MLVKIISGGQTGADRAALVTAKRLGLLTGGAMPKGFFAEDGQHPDFAELYGMIETPSSEYPPRTKWNVANSDGTLALAYDFSTNGEVLTKTCATDCGRPYNSINLRSLPFSYEPFVNWLKRNNIRVLNVAGNRESKHPGTFERTCEVLEKLISLVNSI